MLKLEGDGLREALERCCGSLTWIDAMQKTLLARKTGFSREPTIDAESLLLASEHAFADLDEPDWLEAFSHHPRIGNLDSLASKFATTADLASREQSGAREASKRILEELRSANVEYERQFGYIFIVCATGKSAREMLQLLRARLPNDADSELRQAAAEQRKITHLRLEALLEE